MMLSVIFQKVIRVLLWVSFIPLDLLIFSNVIKFRYGYDAFGHVMEIGLLMIREVKIRLPPRSEIAQIYSQVLVKISAVVSVVQKFSCSKYTATHSCKRSGWKCLRKLTYSVTSKTNVIAKGNRVTSEKHLKKIDQTLQFILFSRRLGSGKMECIFYL